jgi:uncharacterized protein (TIGR03437 family)
MGPAALAGLTINGFGLVDTLVAGTRVLFDGIPAPLVYTSSGQVSAVVPYATAGDTTTQVQVEYLGQRSVPSSFSIAPTSPGIFKLGDAGGGIGVWVVNQDNTLNSPAHPATAGDIVVFYATGAGQTNPAGVDGSVATAPFPVPVQKVSVTIGGVPASLLYQGAAPFEIAGLLQVNAVVPAGLAPSDAAPLVLTIGNASSQTASIAIH